MAFFLFKLSNLYKFIYFVSVFLLVWKTILCYKWLYLLVYRVARFWYKYSHYEYLNCLALCKYLPRITVTQVKCIRAMNKSSNFNSILTTTLHIVLVFQWFSSVVYIFYLNIGTGKCELFICLFLLLKFA